MDAQQAAKPPAMDEDARLRAGWDQMSLLQGFFPRIETKLSVVLGVDLGMLATLLARFATAHPFTWIHVLSLLMCALPLGASLIFLYRGTAPSTEGGNQSLIFFGSISRMTEGNFLHAIHARTTEELIADLYAQVWRNSEILDQKFRALKYAFRLLLIAVVPWVITLFAFGTPPP